MTPEEALERFERTTGYRIHAITDAGGTVWWRQPTAEPMFECTIGDRCMHIDELSVPRAHCTTPVGAHQHSESCHVPTLASPPEPCREEVHSWQHFTPQQMDSYWIRCTLQGPHDEHEDENTGLTWVSQAAPVTAPSLSGGDL